MEDLKAQLRQLAGTHDKFAAQVAADLGAKVQQLDDDFRGLRQKPVNLQQYTSDSQINSIRVHI